MYVVSHAVENWHFKACLLERILMSAGVRWCLNDFCLDIFGDVAEDTRVWKAAQVTGNERSISV